MTRRLADRCYTLGTQMPIFMCFINRNCTLLEKIFLPLVLTFGKRYRKTIVFMWFRQILKYFYPKLDFCFLESIRLLLWDEMHIWARKRNRLTDGGYQIYRMQRSVGTREIVNNQKFQLILDILSTWFRI